MYNNTNKYPYATRLSPRSSVVAAVTLYEMSELQNVVLPHVIARQVATIMNVMPQQYVPPTAMNRIRANLPSAKPLTIYASEV